MEKMEMKLLNVIKWAIQYAWLTTKHKAYVLKAGIMIGAPLYNLVMHDVSKYSFKEVFAYGRKFFGDKGDPKGFELAWIHHQNNNPHHWEYWISRSGHNRLAGDDNQGLSFPVEIPRVYILEMIADWFAAGRAYTGSWTNFDPWFIKNKDRIYANLSPLTQACINRELKSIMTTAQGPRRI